MATAPPYQALKHNDIVAVHSAGVDSPTKPSCLADKVTVKLVYKHYG